MKQAEPVIPLEKCQHRNMARKKHVYANSCCRSEGATIEFRQNVFAKVNSFSKWRSYQKVNNNTPSDNSVASGAERNTKTDQASISSERPQTEDATIITSVLEG